MSYTIPMRMTVYHIYRAIPHRHPLCIMCVLGVLVYAVHTVRIVAPHTYIYILPTYNVWYGMG
jgi:hypothetical protein